MNGVFAVMVVCGLLCSGRRASTVVLTCMVVFVFAHTYATTVAETFEKCERGGLEHVCLQRLEREPYDEPWRHRMCVDRANARYTEYRRDSIVRLYGIDQRELDRAMAASVQWLERALHECATRSQEGGVRYIDMQISDLERCLDRGRAECTDRANPFYVACVWTGIYGLVYFGVVFGDVTRK